MRAPDGDAQTRATSHSDQEAIRDPFYQEFHAKQEAVHVVIVEAREIDDKLYSVFIVQSSTHDGRDLLARFELFFEQFLKSHDDQQIAKDLFGKSNKQRLGIISTGTKSSELLRYRRIPSLKAL